MDCIYRTLGENYLNELLELRMDFIKDIHPEYDDILLNEVKKGSEKYIKDQVSKNAYVGFVGKVDGHVVCTAALVVCHLPPLNTFNDRKIGYVMNFFTKKEHRNKGYAKGLMEYIKNYCWENDFFKITLNATESGLPVYKKTGFEMSIDAMHYFV